MLCSNMLHSTCLLVQTLLQHTAQHLLAGKYFVPTGCNHILIDPLFLGLGGPKNCSPRTLLNVGGHIKEDKIVLGL